MSIKVVKYMNIDKRYINQIEVMINMFTITGGKLKILLFRRDEDPFKGYWMLPSNLLMVNETLEECAQATIDEFIGLEDVYLEQCHMFSKVDRLPNDRILASSFIGLVDNKTVELKSQKGPFYGEWFSINEIPKMVYDYASIVENAILFLRKRMRNISTLKHLYPSDFTLPELQVLYEQVLGKELDRRNFRKKFVNSELLEDTGYKTEGNNGRPAKLYRFKEDTEDRLLF